MNFAHATHYAETQTMKTERYSVDKDATGYLYLVRIVGIDRIRLTGLGYDGTDTVKFRLKKYFG